MKKQDSLCPPKNDQFSKCPRNFQTHNSKITYKYVQTTQRRYNHIPGEHRKLDEIRKPAQDMKIDINKERKILKKLQTVVMREIKNTQKK